MSTHSRLSAAGRKGAEARWGKNRGGQDDNNMEDEMDYGEDDSNFRGRTSRSNSAQSRGGRGNRGVPKDGEPHRPLSRVGDEQGSTGMDEDDLNEDALSGTRQRRRVHTDFAPGKNPNRQAVGKRIASERGYEEFAEQGRKGGHSNLGRHASGGYDDDYSDMESYLEHPEMGVPAKDPRRVQAGKKAAQTRGSQSLSEMGQKGGRSRLGTSNFSGEGDYDYDEGFDDYDERSNKNPNRVQGGLRAAQGRSHEEFSKLGKMGASARWGRKYSDNNEGDWEEDEEGEEEYGGQGGQGGGRGSRRGNQGGQGGQGGGRGQGRGRGRNLSHEEAVELGHKGAEARWHKSSPAGSKRTLSQTNEDDDMGGYDRNVRHESRQQGRIQGVY